MTVVSLAKRLEEVYVPGRSAPIDLPRRYRGLAAAAAGPRRGAPLRDRPPPQPPRQVDDRLAARRAARRRPEARKRALLEHFGSPERVVEATREEIEAVPGISGQARARHPPSAEQGGTMSDGETSGKLFPEPVEVFLITGYSGAGKSEAIAAFEDAGYFCVDNLPPRLIGSLGELFRHEGSNVRRAAVVSDVRGGDYFEELLAGARRAPRRRARPAPALPRGRRRDPDDTASRRPAAATRLLPTAGSSTGSRPSASALGPLRERADVVDRHQRADRGDAAAPDHDRAARPERRSPAAGADPADLRLQERPAARRRPRLRRPLPAQPALPRGPAAADRAGRRASSSTSRPATSPASSTGACCRCSTSSCRPTSPRARPT